MNKGFQHYLILKPNTNKRYKLRFLQNRRW